MRIIICPKCNEKKPHRAKGMCHNCYNLHYQHTHKEIMKKIRKKSYDKFRTKYETDPDFRKKVNKKRYESFKKWLTNPENRKKHNKRVREYLKTRPPILNKIRVGYMCSCGAIDRARILGRVPKKPRHPSGQEYKCPKCGAYSIKRKVIYNRFTGEVEK